MSEITYCLKKCKSKFGNIIMKVIKNYRLVHEEYYMRDKKFYFYFIDDDFNMTTLIIINVDSSMDVIDSDFYNQIQSLKSIYPNKDFNNDGKEFLGITRRENYNLYHYLRLSDNVVIYNAYYVDCDLVKINLFEIELEFYKNEIY